VRVRLRFRLCDVEHRRVEHVARLRPGACVDYGAHAFRIGRVERSTLAPRVGYVGRGPDGLSAATETRYDQADDESRRDTANRRKEMDRMKRPDNYVDDEAPTNVFVARESAAARPSRRADPQPRLMLSPNDAARLLKVNRKTIHTLLAQGLPHQRLGPRIIRIRSSDLLTWGAKNSLTGGK
jgi:hypothetical protein